MDLLLPEDLGDLLRQDSGPCVSIYMPTHRVWSEVPQDPIRLKNLVRDAEHQLVDNGLRSPEARDFLQEVRALGDNETFWRTQCDGLALFLSSEGLHTYRLPLNFHELVVTQERFHVKPLLELFARDARFFVLALNLENVRLLAGTQFNLTQIELKNVPLSLSEALQYDEFEKHQQFHSGTTGTAGGGQRAAVYHGQGDAADDATVKKGIIEFFRRVDNGVCHALSGEQTPLVLAGVDHLRGLYREVNHYSYLAESSVTVNPEELSLKELHSRVWDLAEPYFTKAREEAMETYQYLSANEPDRVSDRLDEVVPAARFKRIKVLFARGDAQSWGSYDPENQKVTLHEEAQAGDQDLLDFAVAHTLRNAGTVYVEDADAMLGQSDVAAIFRY